MTVIKNNRIIMYVNNNNKILNNQNLYCLLSYCQQNCVCSLIQHKKLKEFRKNSGLKIERNNEKDSHTVVKKYMGNFGKLIFSKKILGAVMIWGASVLKLDLHV